MGAYNVFKVLFISKLNFKSIAFSFIHRFFVSPSCSCKSAPLFLEIAGNQPLAGLVRSAVDVMGHSKCIDKLHLGLIEVVGY